jgi:hypothetical protein
MKVLLRYEDVYRFTESKLLTTLWYCPPHRPLIAVGELAHVCDFKSEPLTTITPPACHIRVSDRESARSLEIELALLQTFAHCITRTPPTITITTMKHAETLKPVVKQIIVVIEELEVYKLESIVARFEEYSYRLVHFDLRFDTASTMLFARFTDDEWWD